MRRVGDAQNIRLPCWGLLMGIFQRIASILGLTEEEEEEAAADDARYASGDRSGAARGFVVRAAFGGPVIVPCDAGEGSVQGFNWYTRRLRIDEEGDVANEFLVEVIAERPATGNRSVAPPKFQVNRSTQPTATVMREEIVVVNGNIRQSMEYHGRLQWV